MSRTISTQLTILSINIGSRYSRRLPLDALARCGHADIVCMQDVPEDLAPNIHEYEALIRGVIPATTVIYQPGDNVAFVIRDWVDRASIQLSCTIDPGVAVIECATERSRFVLANVSAPRANIERFYFFKDVLACFMNCVMLSAPQVPLIIVGDFNDVPAALDLVFPSGTALANRPWQRALKAHMQAAQVVDLYRLRYPNTIVGSYCRPQCSSLAVKSFSRVDLLLGNDLAAETLVECSYVDFTSYGNINHWAILADFHFSDADLEADLIWHEDPESIDCPFWSRLAQMEPADPLELDKSIFYRAHDLPHPDLMHQDLPIFEELIKTRQASAAAITPAMLQSPTPDMRTISIAGKDFGLPRRVAQHLVSDPVHAPSSTVHFEHDTSSQWQICIRTPGRDEHIVRNVELRSKGNDWYTRLERILRCVDGCLDDD